MSSPSRLDAPPSRSERPQVSDPGDSGAPRPERPTALRFPRGRAAAVGWPGEAAKRLLDIALAATGLVLSAPFWIAIPLAIRLEDGGPVFFGQERVGRYGKLFRSWKFRSMRVHGEGGEGTESAAPRQATADDPRITRVGRAMRKTALDELPQLWNILRGDMSFVGPRALLPRERAVGGNGTVDLRELPGFEERHSVRPGLTGLAQARAARDISHRAKLRYDLLYVRRRTFWLDVRLIAESVWISLRGAWPKVGRDGG